MARSDRSSARVTPGSAPTNTAHLIGCESCWPGAEGRNHEMAPKALCGCLARDRPVLGQCRRESPGPTLPTPVKPDELTPVIQSIHAAKPGGERQPEYADRLLSRLLAAQREHADMTPSMTLAVKPDEVFRPLPHISARSAKTTRQWLAIAASLPLRRNNRRLICEPTQYAREPGRGRANRDCQSGWNSWAGSDRGDIAVAGRRRGGCMLYPVEAAIAPDGSIWTIDGARGHIRIYSPDGALVGNRGTPGSGPGNLRSWPTDTTRIAQPGELPSTPLQRICAGWRGTIQCRL